MVKHRFTTVAVGLLATISAACGSGRDGRDAVGSPSPTRADTATSTGAASTPTTAQAKSGFLVKGSSQLQDRDGYKFQVTVDVNIKGASVSTTNSKPGFAKVVYDATASVGYQNTTGGGRSATLTSRYQVLRLLWDLDRLSGAAASHCSQAPFVIKGKNYCILGYITFRINQNVQAEFIRKVADGQTTSFVHPSKYKEPEEAASLNIPEDAARAVVDMFNRGQGPDQVGVTGDQKQYQPSCLIGKDLDVAAIANVWWMFLVDRTGVVNNSIC